MENYVTIKCKTCGVSFEVIPYRQQTAKYCSKVCKGLSVKFNIQGGEKFNRLTILREVEPEIQYAKGKPTKLRKVECLCDCGNKTIARLVMVRNGDTQSCGCVKQEQDKENLGNSTHGLCKHPLYAIWNGMKFRCYNENCERFGDYGGRGITVCERWLTSFENFYSDMIDGYKSGLEIERINNDGNYEPSNCKWDTHKNQSNNKRTTIWVIYNNEKIPFTLACEKYGFNRDRVKFHMKKGTVSFQQAVDKIAFLDNNKQNHARA